MQITGIFKLQIQPQCYRLADNLLSIENGKLYVGREASDDAVALYIDCINGTDNSPGTRSAPLRTLQRANELTPSHRSSTWYIKYYTVDQMDKANAWC